jgi:hypothetical protein
MDATTTEFDPLRARTTTPPAAPSKPPTAKPPEPMSEEDAIADAYRLAREIRTLLEANAKTLRTQLGRILQDQKRPEAIQHILAVVRDDGAGAVDLKAVADEFEPAGGGKAAAKRSSTRRSTKG